MSLEARIITNCPDKSNRFVFRSNAHGIIGSCTQAHQPPKAPFLMKLRFRTRMTLTFATAAALTVLVMTLVSLTIAVTSTRVFYVERGLLLTKLATRNLERGMMLPEQVTRRVEDQMVVSALLAAELVAVAEARAQMSPAEISALFKRVIEQSKDLRGYPLVDEFWVTDETGRAYIRTQEQDFQFPLAPDDASQAAPFGKLLLPDARPVVQPLQARTLDGKPYLYVGVGGRDKPRIVQVGAGEPLVRSIQSDFMAQHMLQQFISRAGQKDAPKEMENLNLDGVPNLGRVDTDVTRMAIIAEDGRVEAAAGQAAEAGLPSADQEVVAFCRAFLQSPGNGAAMREFGSELGVATLLPNPEGGRPQALFMQHRLDTYERVLDRRVRFTMITGAIMIVISVLMSLWLARQLSSPIMELCQAVRRFGAGDLDQRITIKADREFQIMADSFNQMADSLQEQMRELREETQLRERMESELLIAAQLQRSLLPEEMPRVDRLELAAWNRPAREVGGDFYDFVLLGNGLLGIAVGDGTDKGLPAAMLSTECWSVFRALATPQIAPPELLYRTNNALHRRIGATGRFVTMFYMTVDTHRGWVRYSVAGHHPPLLAGADPGRVLRLSSEAGLPLGVAANCAFDEISLRLEPNDTVLLYSDGIVEAQSQQGEFYTEARLIEFLIQHRHEPVQELLAALWRDLEAHMGCDEVSDDMTVVAVRFSGQAAGTRINTPGTIANTPA